MKITYTLYHDEKPQGTLLATLTGEVQSFLLETHFKEVYNNENFKVTKKNSRQKEQLFCGSWEN